MELQWLHSSCPEHVGQDGKPRTCTFKFWGILLPITWNFKHLPH